MSITWRIAETISSSSNAQPVSGSYFQTGTSEINISQNFSANTNASLVSVSFNAAGNTAGALQAFILLSTQNTTVRTNNANANTAQDTINLIANIPLEWDVSQPYTCPFSNSVNSFYVSCTAAAFLQGKILKY